MFLFLEKYNFLWIPNCFTFLKQLMFVNKIKFRQFEMSWHFTCGGIVVTQCLQFYNIFLLLFQSYCLHLNPSYIIVILTLFV